MLVTPSIVSLSTQNIVLISFSGPYYRFRTFQDLYEKPYAKYAECELAMWIRLSRVPIYVILFLISGYLFPLKVRLAIWLQ